MKTHSRIERHARFAVSLLGSRLFLLAIAGFIIGSTAQQALSQVQSGTVNPLQDLNRPDGYDPFSSTGGNNGVTPGFFEFVHRAIQNQGGPTQEEFTADQGKNLDSAAAAFRAKQRERLQMPQTSQTPPVE